jgi:hypothetical protein
MRFNEFKQLAEVKINPTTLGNFAKSEFAKGIKLGVEYELCFPGVTDDVMYHTIYNYENIASFFFSDNPTKQAQALSIMDQRHQVWAYQSLINKLTSDKNEYKKWVSNFVDNASDIINQYTPEQWLDSDANAKEEMTEKSLVMFNHEDWLRASGIRTYNDAAAVFNLEPPRFFSMEQLADDFRKETGYDVVVQKGHGNRAGVSPDVWILESDSSIKPGYGYNGVELVSPALPLDDALEAMEWITEWAKYHKARTNESTGLHMNLSIPEYNIDKLDYVKLALFIGDRYVLSAFKRYGNQYAQSALDIIEQKIENRPNTVAHILETMKSKLNTGLMKMLHSGETTKYTSLNTAGKETYLEFRGPGNDYLNKPLPELIQTALRFAQGLVIACDENAHQAEYSKKLYKMLSANISDPLENTMAIFAKFISGSISEKEAVYNLKKIRSFDSEADKFYSSTNGSNAFDSMFN